MNPLQLQGRQNGGVPRGGAPRGAPAQRGNAAPGRGNAAAAGRGNGRGIAQGPLFQIARQPFNAHTPHAVHTLQRMIVECPECGALHWDQEKTSRSTVNVPKFGMCCFTGKVKIPQLHEIPPTLRNMLRSTHDISKKFRRHIRDYNSSLAFTSIGGKKPTNTVAHMMEGGGIGVFKVHGELHHYIGSLLPYEVGIDPSFAQLYIYDSNYAISRRANLQTWDPAVMRQLQDMLYTHHDGVKVFRQAWDLMRQIPPGTERFVSLHLNENADRRRYNLPNAASECIAAIIPANPHDAKTRDIILTERGGGLKRISELHPMFPSMHFVLLFPTGQLGWHPKLTYKDGEQVENNPPPRAPGQEEEENQEPTKRGYVTQLEYTAYRLHTRKNESDHLFRSERLFQEYIVSMWASNEQFKLSWVSNHQKQLRAETYAGVADSIGNADGANIGKRVILPSSFSGGSRNMVQHCQDALALNRHFGGADLFFTMTANPKWPEILAELLPGQDAASRPDIVTRVFQLKKKALLHDILENHVLGHVVARVLTIEFQKRGLPHMHSVLFLHPDSKLKTPEDVDSLISSEFPDKETQPELYEKVLKYMVHTPCGAENGNPNAPCLENGKCSKGFPKPFHEATTMTEDAYVRTRRRNTGEEHIIKLKGKEYKVDNRWVVAYVAYLLFKYDCHINVEAVFSIKSIKYIYKYVYKGHDRITMGFGESVDEVQMYLDSRYVSSCEALWRIYQFSMHEEKPNIVRLQVHLLNQQTLVWNSDTSTMEQVLEGSKDSTLMAWFKANAKYPEARDLLYQEAPSKFSFDSKKRCWIPRTRSAPAIGRMYYSSPNQGERFYLRLLLTICRGEHIYF